MDILVGLCCMCCLCCCMVCLFRQPVKQEQPKAPEETPEEREARRIAAEAQQLYEQGFVNLMSYDGSPRKREERDQI